MRKKKQATGEFTISIGLGDGINSVYILDSNEDVFSRRFVSGSLGRAHRVGKKLKKLAEQGVRVND